MLIGEEDYLAHYGILRRSGRYPWGSGGDDSTRNRDFLGYIDDLRSKGLSDTEIAKGLGISTTDFRAARSIAKNQQKQADIAMAQRLKEKGLSNVAIAQRMGLAGESSVRSLLAPGEKDKADVLRTTADMLKEQVDKKGYIDVGIGVERHIGVSKEKLKTAISILQDEGYELHNVQIDQLGTNSKTIVKVLAPPGTQYRDIAANKDKIQSVAEYSTDGGRSYTQILPPKSISSKRVAVRYAEQGGSDADGVIYVRPGVNDLSLGGNRYAQVRVAVDGTHFLKGMAMYKDDLPDGVDLMFNTNKSNTGNKLDAMKPLKDDPDLPFGAVISRQVTRKKADGSTELTSVMNIVNDEATWEKWSKNLSSQMLSKQPKSLAKTQLDLTYEQKKAEFDRINSLTNPVVKQKLLDEFADGVDASAVHLKAAHLPKQKTHVILPVNSMKDNEVYAPNYNNGDRVVLIRFPHGGKFEIPELVVNNRQPEAKKLLGRAPNAIGINSKVAQRLSGADFDGDTVLVIPNNKGLIKTEKPLEGLKNFDPIHSYPAYEGMPKMSARTKGIQMGLVSNLITDMTIQGAPNSELARAVRHSMVVIDAEKHNLNYKQSAIDNGIAQLMLKYQGRAQGGARTIVSRKKGTIDVPERKTSFRVDPATGEKIYKKTGASYVDRATGKTVFRTSKVNRLAETKDANELTSGTPIEKIYADHSNRLKALANEARKVSVNTKTEKSSSSAKTTYAKEVASLNAKLNIALRNAPLERQAQVLANAEVAQKRRANPDMEASELKKIKGLALTTARIRTGAKKERIEITDAEWEAIQAGAIASTKLRDILNNADMERVKQLATPKTELMMTTAKQQRAKAMFAAGYTQAEIANALGVSLTTLKRSFSE